MHKKAGSRLEIIDHVRDETPPDSKLEFNIVDRWDEVDPYSCVTCQLPFDSKVGRLPYLLPCRHNACLNCLKDCLENFAWQVWGWL